MIDLKATYGDIYKITLDESATIDGQSREDREWLQVIPGKRGHIFISGMDRLGAHCNRPKLIARLLAIPGVSPAQRGDREVNVTLDPGNSATFTQVADLFQLRKRKVYSPAVLEAMREKGRRLAAANPRHRDKTEDFAH